ncbi:MAG: hypothetical protein HETSPECPRED_001603 [Heterodermia speciosa]|uniref:Cyclin-domain-containing protein n=1 Tax=Heterodermia speciosa TaxID=116794 RepID=A0A8H3IAJ9_9LECA|nr:MAG: hypothetical protein HETSPECPRED_001603 [Heterodermia speciosa]
MPTPKHHSKTCEGSDHVPALPPPPEPSADGGIVPTLDTTSKDSDAIPQGYDIDIFTLSSVAALKILCGTVETLVKITGDVPPTPPVSAPNTPISRVIRTPQIIRAIAQSEAKITQKSCQDRPPTPYAQEMQETSEPMPPSAERDTQSEPKDVPPRAKTPIGSPEAHPAEGLHIIGSNMEPLNVQHGAITRKFYSKRPPPIPLEEYLLRLHRYCPMSTGVYLATSLYIHRLAIIEKILPVTARNAHRLLLAGLRVAMKALEDLSYPHRRFAKVGGITETELGRLEVSFCFVTNFELKVTSKMLLEHVLAVRDGLPLTEAPTGFQPKLPHMRDMPLRTPSMATAEALKSETPAAA